MSVLFNNFLRKIVFQTAIYGICSLVPNLMIPNYNEVLAAEPNPVEVLTKAIGNLEKLAEEGKLIDAQKSSLDGLRKRLAVLSSAVASDITDTATKLTHKLNNYTLDALLLEDSLLGLIPEIEKQLVRIPDGKGNQRARLNLAVNALSGALTNVQKDAALQRDIKIQDALLSLVVKITKSLRNYYPVQLTSKYLDGLKLIINADSGDGDDRYQPNLNLTELQKNLNALVKAIEDVKFEDPETLLIRKATSLIDHLTVDSSQTGSERTKNEVRVAYNRKRIVTSVLAMQKRKALLDALLTINDNTGRRIHIHSAIYGDLNKGVSWRRQCNATVAIRKSCQGKNACEQSTDIQGADKLCGFDPIPLAADETKMIVIRYFCIKRDRKYWDQLAMNPAIKPKTVSTGNSRQLKRALMRKRTFQDNAAWEFRCSANEATLLEGVE